MRRATIAGLTCLVTLSLATRAFADLQQICRTATAGLQSLGGNSIDSDSSCAAAASAQHTTDLPGCFARSSATADATLSYSAGAGSGDISFSGAFLPISIATVKGSGCFCGGPSPGAEFASASVDADLLVSRPFSLSALTFYKLNVFSIASPGTPSGSVQWRIDSAFGTLESGGLSGQGAAAPRCFVGPPGNYVFNGEVAAHETLAVSTELNCSETLISSGSVHWTLSISAISCPSGDLDKCCGSSGGTPTE